MTLINDAVYANMIQTSSLSSSNKTSFTQWASNIRNELKNSSPDGSFSSLLACVPTPPNAGLIPLASLALLLSYYRGPPPAFKAIRLYIELWPRLPESVKSGRDQNEAQFLQQILRQIATCIGDLPSLLNSTSSRPALVDSTSHNSLSHEHLSTFIRNFRLPLHFPPSTQKPVIAVALPNGFFLGLSVLAVSSYYTAAPINISGGASQFRNDVKLANPRCILVRESDIPTLGLLDSWVADSDIQLLLVRENKDSTFDLEPSDQKKYLAAGPPIANFADDLALILFTSGTSGTKKVVPITTFGLLVGVSCVVDSWGLTQNDSCLNMMPLNHVGGLVRNLFAPVLAGGATILCPAFDPNLFWDLLEERKGTWYYASPSMHMSILAEGEIRGDAVSKCTLRLVCNAAGGLLPALATRLKNTFNCTVLPSYGMTECMPISTPPLGYRLDRAGTSGIGCGPEICIFDDAGNRLPPGQVGQIQVRGGPVFLGYLENGNINKSAFSPDGWFDTGDLGLLDNDGYLFLTGRGKEIINRGGEIISPFEIEEAITIASQDTSSILHGRIEQVLAFSAPHEVLQEVVGVAIVTRKSLPRPDLRDLQMALKPLLHSTKLPVVVVYMTDLPTSNNKLVRIRFGERMDMAPLTNEMKLIEKHFEASCPPLNSSLNTKISNSICCLESAKVLDQVKLFMGVGIEAHVRNCHHDGTPIVYLAPGELPADIIAENPEIALLESHLRNTLDAFLLPSQVIVLEAPFPRNNHAQIDEELFDAALRKLNESNYSPSLSLTERLVRGAFSSILGFTESEISSSSDFFNMGGDSMSAGQLLSILRRDLKVRVPVDQLFISSSVSELCTLVDKILLNSSKTTASTQSKIGCTETYSSTNPLVLLINLIPLLLLYPMKIALQWTTLMYSLSSISSVWSEPNMPSRFLALIASMFFSRALAQIVAPTFGILMKWLVIGKYTQGIYPMWGPYHTRWWIVDKTLQICGQGVFQHLEATRTFYYRLLGAKIGKGVTIEEGTTLGEFDLLEIGDNTFLDRCICRPFAAETNSSMYLGRISIGRNCVVGLKSHISAGSDVPDDTFIGANSSSYEMNSNAIGPISKPKVKPHFLLQIFGIIPIQVLVLFVSSLPWMGGLVGIVSNQTQSDTNNVKSIVLWWATPHRIGYHYLARSLNVVVRPFVWMTLVVIIKFALNKTCGITRPIPTEQKTSKDYFRSNLLSELVPNGSLRQITQLFGSHYEFTSMIMRALGAKVGQRVYWPGTGPSIQDFDLLEIGDDVVFGSRSHLVTSDSTGSDKIRIGNGAMIADRVVANPGTIIGGGTVLGSGAFIKRNQICEPKSIWVGNKDGSALCLSGQSNRQNEKPNYYGDSSKESPASSNPPSYPGSITSPEVATTSTPFGRAFYQGQATYHVFGQTFLFVYSTFITVFTHFYWDVGVLSTVILSRTLMAYDQFDPHWYQPFKLYACAVVVLSCLYSVLSVLSLLFVIAAKWILLGRREVGNYDWDKSSYCQRWQLFLTIEAIRRRCFGGFGVLGLFTGTHFIVLYFRALGATIGKDCSLFSGGRPGLMFTEPDLLTLGDRVAVDDASLVGHVNSRGKFSLNELHVGSRSVLRSGSRLLSGARMGEESVLLEHTLIMAGDVADDGVTYQGWPADVFHRNRVNLQGI